MNRVNPNDLIGKTFNNRTIISFIKKIPQSKNNRHSGYRYLYLIKCNDCGIEKTISYRRSLDKSICNQCKPATTNRENLYRRVLSSYRRKAEIRGLEFSLTLEDIGSIINKVCYYCDGSFSNKQKRHKTTYKYNGIDRKDNDLGYTKENSITCCKMCNIAKNNHTLKDFYDWVTRITVKRYKTVMNLTDETILNEIKQVSGNSENKLETKEQNNG